MTGIVDLNADLGEEVTDDEALLAVVTAQTSRAAGAVVLDLAAAGRGVLLEGFPDRAHGDDGRLVPRDQPGAALSDSATIAANAVELARTVDSVCVHGDSPGAVDHARAVRRALEDAGWVLRGL